MRAGFCPVPVKTLKLSQAQHSAPWLPQQKHNMLAPKDHSGRDSNPKEYHHLHYTVSIVRGIYRSSNYAGNKQGKWEIKMMNVD